MFDLGIYIESIGYALPELAVSNKKLSEEFPDWDFKHLEERTGVAQRHIVTDGETALDLSILAFNNLV